MENEKIRDIKRLVDALQQEVNVDNRKLNMDKIKKLLAEIDALVKSLDMSKTNTVWEGIATVQHLFSEFSFTSCKQCEELQKQISTLSENLLTLQTELNDCKNLLNNYKETAKAAVRRQIAINIIFEVKVKFLEECQDQSKAPYYRNKIMDEAKIERTELDLFEELLRNEDTTKYNQIVKLVYPTGRERFLTAMWHLKQFSSSGAHPTNIDNKPVNYKTAEAIIKETKPRVSRSQKSQQVAIKNPRKDALRALKLLNHIRNANGHSQLLYNFFD